VGVTRGEVVNFNGTVLHGVAVGFDCAETTFKLLEMILDSGALDATPEKDDAKNNDKTKFFLEFILLFNVIKYIFFVKLD
jgi:hypothetical protein